MKSCLNPPPSKQNYKLKQKSEVVTSITHASQRSYKLYHTQNIKYLNLDYFKLNPCQNNKTHPHKQCMNFHNAKDHKRYGNFYSDTMCQYITKGEQCPNGPQCLDAHSRVQQLYQHQNYKKKFCSHYPNNIQKCQYGNYCSFAHNQQQIRIQLIHNYQFDEDFYMFHYKTQSCPFNLTQHDKSKCVYAHNLQDYRRNPVNYYYQPIACYNWNLKQKIYQYTNGCDKGFECNMCHGWKQLQYHPNYYRTNKCMENKCKKGECANYHNEKQRRIIQQQVLNCCFRIVPRNRITKGTFKTYDQLEHFIAKQSPTKIQSSSSIASKQNSKAHSSLSLQSSQYNYTEQQNTNIDIKTTTKTQQQYNRYLLDQQQVESGNQEQQSIDDADIIGDVQKLMIDQ